MGISSYLLEKIYNFLQFIIRVVKTYDSQKIDKIPLPK